MKSVILASLVSWVYGAYDTVNVGSSNSLSNFGCAVVTGSTTNTFHTGMESQSIGGKYYWWALDSNGGYNYFTSGGISTKKGSDDFSGSSDSNPEKLSHGGKPGSVSGCQSRCDSIGDKCTAIAHESNNGRNYQCLTMVRCSPLSPSRTESTRSGYVKKTFSTFTATEVKPHTKCSGTSLGAASNLGLSEPVNPAQCYTECSGKAGAQWFQLNRAGQCECFSSCSYVQYSQTGSDDQIMGGDDGHITVYKFPQAPTPAPVTPTNPTTPTTPTTPTPPPSNPTPAPTNPTPAPTNPTAAPASSDNDNTGIYAAIGGVGGILLIGGLIEYWRRSNERNRGFNRYPYGPSPGSGGYGVQPNVI